MIFGTIVEFYGFEKDPETNHLQTNMAEIIGSCKYRVRKVTGDGPEDYIEEDLCTTLRPGENFGWSLVVIAAAQAWLDNGGVIPEYTKPSDSELAATIVLRPWQFHAAMEIAGKTQAVMDAIEAMPLQTRAIAKSKLTYSTGFQINDPLIAGLIANPAINLTKAELETLWVAASKLT